MNKVEKFWIWFARNCHAFGENFENESLINELDKQIEELGELTWELGPGRVNPNALVISPNGNLALLEQTKKIVSQSIQCEGWEYYYAKPIKIWDYSFWFETSNGDQIEIDVSQWHYVLLRYPDNMFGILIKSVNLDYLSESDKVAIGEIALDGVLGEELRITVIDEIEISDGLEPEYEEKKSEFIQLNNHINRLLNI